MNMVSPISILIVAPEPKLGDRRERNGFGYLRGFGKAYAAYYAAKDRKEKNDHR